MNQRDRLLAAVTELLAGAGYRAVKVGALAERAGVSRATVYEHFSDKDECLLAAYDRFAARLLEASVADVRTDMSWEESVRAVVGGYLGALDADRVAARAFMVGINEAGPIAWERRRAGAREFARLLAERHAAMIEMDSRMQALSDRTYLGMVLGIRGLVREALEEDPQCRLGAMAPDLSGWIIATVRGASEPGSPDER